MKTIYKQRGSILTLTAPKDIPIFSGNPVIIENLFAIPVADAMPGEKFAAHLTGCWDIPKADREEEIKQCQSAYWQAENKGVTAQASYKDTNDNTIDNKRIGDFIESSPENAQTVGVRLNGSF